MKNITLNDDENLTNSSYSSQMRTQSIVFVSIFSIIFIFGIAANLLVMLVYLFNKNLKNHSNYFFVNLSLSDLLVITVCIPIAVSDLIYDGEWIFGYFYCKFYFLN